MIQIVRHTSECDTVDVGQPHADRETALSALKTLLAFNVREDDFDLVDTETDRYVSWVLS